MSVDIRDVPCLSCQDGYRQLHTCDVPDHCPCTHADRHILSSPSPEMFARRDEIKAEIERLEAAERQPVLHSCGYVEDTFACKIRHQYLQHGWAKGDH